MKYPQSVTRNLLYRIPLTLKITIFTCIVGVIVWVATDYLQSRTLKRFFEDLYNVIITERAVEDRMRFDQYVKLHFQSVKLFSTQKRFNDYLEYLENKNWSEEDTAKIKYYTHPPPWFPDVSVMRTFVPAHFVILTDGKKRVREIYTARHDELPEFLLNPKTLLFQLSQNQSYLTSYKGTPYIIASKSIFGPERQLRGILTLASPINDEFLAFSQGVSIRNTIVALVTALKPRVIASSHPELLPVGTEVDTLRDRFLIIEEAFFDYGNSDLLVKLATFVSTNEIESLTGTILNKQRKQFFIGSVIFVLSFMFIMFWLTRRIHVLTQSISDFSEETLGMQQEDIGKGDKLHILEERFKHLTKEVVEARDIIKREAEEKTRLIVENAFDAIITMDSGGLITTWNPQAETTFGWSSQEILGKTVFDTIVLSENRNAGRLKELLATGKEEILNKTIEITGLHRDGHKFPIELAVVHALSGDEHIFIAILRDITERRIAEEQIQASLEEKEVLLREIHHRVKNNMQVVTSLLRLQSRKINDKNTIEMLKESQNRIRSMALIHEKLYKSGDLAQINFKGYIDDLTRGLYRSYGADTEMVALRIDAGDFLLGVDSAIPCGLIINELVSNSLKHGFPDNKKGEISISIHKTAEEEIEMIISDTGVGMPEGLDFRNAGSMGLKLVTTLSENQLNGKIMFAKAEGTGFRIIFKEIKRKEKI